MREFKLVSFSVIVDPKAERRTRRAIFSLDGCMFITVDQELQGAKYSEHMIKLETGGRVERFTYEEVYRCVKEFDGLNWPK